MRAATFGATVLLLIPLALAAQQAPSSPVTPGAQATGSPGTTKPRQSGNEQTGSATIRGRVVRADTGEPLRRVQVRAIATESHTALTDSDGRYELTNLPAGSFQLTASKGGFVETQYGQRRPFRAGRALALADAARLEKIDFALAPGGVIAGHRRTKRYAGRQPGLCPHLLSGHGVAHGSAASPAQGKRGSNRHRLSIGDDTNIQRLRRGAQ